MKLFSKKMKATFAIYSVILHTAVVIGLFVFAGVFKEVRSLIFNAGLWGTVLGSFVASITAIIATRAAEKNSINKHYDPRRDTSLTEAPND